MKINNKQSKELALRIKKKTGEKERCKIKQNKSIYHALIEIQENGSEKDKVPRG